MSEEIIKILDDLGSRFGIAIDWTSENILPYLQDLMERFIAYKNAVAIFWIILLSIIFGILIFFIVELIRYRKKKDEDYDEEFFIFCMAFILLILTIVICFLVINIHNLIQNIYIPELTVIEYLKSNIN